MNNITGKLLDIVASWMGEPENAAYNIREDGLCAARKSTENIQIENKEGLPGIRITVAPGTKGETAYIPACVTKSGVDDLVYNDFYIGEGADVTIIAGCGVHSEGEEQARHNGIHRFFVGKGAKVRYVEKHVGTGQGTGARVINPKTAIEIEQDGQMEMESTQIGGVDRTDRVTEAKLAQGARLLVRERLLTEGEQQAATSFDVEINGPGAGCDLISRSVAKDHSHQDFRSKVYGNAPCTGHSECDAILIGHGAVAAAPELIANHPEAALIHEAAIGKIAGEQLLKLQTLGLTEQQAEEKIVEGFLR